VAASVAPRLTAMRAAVRWSIVTASVWATTSWTSRAIWRRASAAWAWTTRCCTRAISIAPARTPTRANSVKVNTTIHTMQSMYISPCEARPRARNTA
jgi:hypothetical protein